MFLYCHDCDLYVQPTEDHIHHALEMLKDESDPPTFQRPNRIIACYNIYDDLDALRISLASIAHRVDGVIFVYGPYRLIFDPTGLQTEQEAEAEEKKHYQLVQQFMSEDQFQWISSFVWENEMEKRNAYLQAPFLRDGDYILIIDDDELFMSTSMTSLKTTIAWANRKAFTIGWRNATTEKLNMDVKNPKAFTIPLFHRGFRRAPDAITMMRLLRWNKNLRYYPNHSTIVDNSQRDDQNRPQIIIPEAMLWNMSLMHVEDLKDVDRVRKKRQYYLMRNQYKLEGERDPDQSKEI